MRAQTVDIQEGAGRILSTTIFRPGGKKLMAKGHLLRAEDIRALEMEGMKEVWVAQLEDGECRRMKRFGASRQSWPAGLTGSNRYAAAAPIWWRPKPSARWWMMAC